MEVLGVEDELLRVREHHETSKVVHTIHVPSTVERCAFSNLRDGNEHGNPICRHPFFQLQLCNGCHDRLQDTSWMIQPRLGYPGHEDMRCRCCGMQKRLQHCSVEMCNHKLCSKKPFAEDHYCAIGICDDCLQVFWKGDHKEDTGQMRMFWRCPFCRYGKRHALHESPHLCVENWSSMLNRRSKFAMEPKAKPTEIIDTNLEPKGVSCMDAALENAGQNRERLSRSEKGAIAEERTSHLPIVSEEIGITSLSKLAHAESNLGLSSKRMKLNPEENIPSTSSKFHLREGIPVLSDEPILKNLLTGKPNKEFIATPPSAQDFWEIVSLSSSEDEDKEEENRVPLQKKVRVPRLRWSLEETIPRTAKSLEIFLARYNSWCKDPENIRDCPTFSDPALLTSSSSFQKPCFEWPKFLYEQVFMPSKAFKGIASSIHSHLWDEPILAIDSGGLFSSARRSRCYCTNLRGHEAILQYASRFHIKPLQEFLDWPRERPWPLWASTAWFDNVLRAIVGLSCPSPKAVTQIKHYIRSNPGTQLQKQSEREMLQTIRRYNLVPSPAGLTPEVLPIEKVEEAMGFPVGHTASCDLFHATENQRRKMLGDSFQVDTVGYLLSPFLKMQREGMLPPEGITVISLFDGIGGAIVALHKIGVRVARIITCEKDEQRRMVMKNWLLRNLPEAQHVEFSDVMETSTGPANTSFIRGLLQQGKIHLVVGGSPCQNISLLNRVSSKLSSGRSGFSGEDSHLFFSYMSILRKCKEESEVETRTA